MTNSDTNSDDTVDRADGPTFNRRGQRKRETIKYRDLADALREMITTGQLPPGSVLPSETELMRQYDVSRPTARAAVSALKGEGLLHVQHGRGAFVRRNDDRPRHTWHRALHGTRSHIETTTDPATDAATDAAADQNWHEVEEPTTYRVNADVVLVLALGIVEHTPVFVADRLFEHTDGQRAAYRTWVPITVARECPPLETWPYPHPVDLYTALTDTYGQLTWTETVRARMPAPDDQTALHIGDNIPMLITRRVTTDKTGRVLAMEETRYTAEDTQLSYALTPAKQAGRAR